jgi:hypothetical protein
MIPQRKRIDVDVIKDVLLAVQKAVPHSEFVSSLLRQYEERGNLSRKQLEGLLGKAKKTPSVSESRCATLEAIIKKMHVRDKTPPSAPKPFFEKDEETAKRIQFVLSVFPQHRQVLFLQAKYDNNEIISPGELTELEKFYKLAQKKK